LSGRNDGYLPSTQKKCKVMHIGHDLPTKYTMNTEDKGILLEDITTEKDLGIWITIET